MGQIVGQKLRIKNKLTSLGRQDVECQMGQHHIALEKEHEHHSKDLAFLNHFFTHIIDNRMPSPCRKERASHMHNIGAILVLS